MKRPNPTTKIEDRLYNKNDRLCDLIYKLKFEKNDENIIEICGLICRHLHNTFDNFLIR